MLQVDFIKENFSKVVNSLKKRNKDYSTDLKKIIDTDPIDFIQKLLPVYKGIENPFWVYPE